MRVRRMLVNAMILSIIDYGGIPNTGLSTGNKHKMQRVLIYMESQVESHLYLRVFILLRYEDRGEVDVAPSEPILQGGGEASLCCAHAEDTYARDVVLGGGCWVVECIAS